MIAAFVLWYVISCVVVASVASRRGESSALYLLFSILLTPFLMVLVLIAEPVKKEAAKELNK